MCGRDQVLHCDPYESVIKKFIKFNKSHLKIVCTNEYKKKQEGFKFCEIFYIDDNNNIN